jgi:anti-sigma-K factor RskA
MNAMHDEQALAAAYVLGALEPAERASFEAHLATCAACSAEVRSLSRAADALAHSPPQVTPRAELRDRVLRAVTRRSGAELADTRPHAPRQTVRGWLPLAAAVVIAAGLGVHAWRLQQRVAVLESRLGDAELRATVAERATADARRAVDDAQTSLSVLAAPDLVRIDLAGEGTGAAARGRAMWSRNRGMVLTVTGLPQAPAGRVYQVWVVTAQAPVSAGLLTTDASGGASAYFQTPTDIAPPIAVAVTLEPAGGVPAPTGGRVLVGTPL